MAARNVDEHDRLNKQFINSYLDILSFFQGRTSGRRPDLPHMPKNFGIEKLYHSFSSVIEPVPSHSNEFMEWNPLSQRPTLFLRGNLSKDTPLGSRISQLEELVHSFVLNTHEMMHVLTWEPFFTGQVDSMNFEKFLNFSMASEGFCFFHTDILTSPQIKLKFPDQELILKKKTVSSLNFNALSAFKKLGVHDKKKILEIYLSAFMGEKSILLNDRKDMRIDHLALRIYNFHAESRKPLQQFYKYLHQFNTFSEFYKRFCQISQIPRLLREKDLKLANESNPKLYFRNLNKVGLKKIDQLAKDQIANVRLRRAIQTRAYYAFQLRYILQKKIYFGKAFSQKERQKLSSNLEEYLDQLNALLVTLCREGRNPKRLDTDLLQIDKFYELKVRKVFIRKDLWVADRSFLLMRGFRPAVKIGLSSTKSKTLTSLQARNVVSFLLEEQRKNLNENLNFQKKKSLVQTMGRVLKLQNDLATKKGEVSLSVSKKLTTILKNSGTKSLWTVPLAKIDPLKNYFQELLFVYE